ncbi:LADA_0E13036g1_1 [Lachancea dasiensis]|uniref:LADA_0E13036g1_1 n=1 Tax=Lachancea dasiensis TaxID=1072105 RepID=A0A1G4JFJ6_9SACH|nr:LADA_0E13036g1_1 [Lachancea dasiensis]
MLFKLLWYLLVGAPVLVCCSNSKLEQLDTDTLAFPEPLTAINFDMEMSKHLHLVEFYSPYCHHCKALAPTWEKTWRTFFNEGRKLNISLVQINCVESGDLCARERINSYPAIKLYGPSGFIKDYPDSLKRTSEALINFARQEALNVDNFDSTLLESQSISLKGSELLRLLAGAAEKSYLVSFWPSSSLDRPDNSDVAFEKCNVCPAFQKTWTVISNNLPNEGYVTAHVNCETERIVCEELGFNDLAELRNHRQNRAPRVALIVPNKETNNFFPYTGGDQSVRAIEDFALRTNANAQIPDVDEKALRALVSEFQPIKQTAEEIDTTVHVVFKYDAGTVVPEDFDILEQLIEPVSKIPNTYLHKSTDDLKQLSHDLYTDLYQAVNQLPEERDIFPNEEFFTMTTLTQYPTFFIFKQNGLIPSVFHGYSTTEMRNLELILDWINRNTLPVINELTPTTYEGLLNFFPDWYEYMTIMFVDSSDNELSQSMKFINDCILSTYDFESVRSQNLMEEIRRQRSRKAEEVENLTAKHATSSSIVDKMREEIAHDDGHRVLFAFLDLAKYRSLLNDEGLRAGGRHYQNGEVIIIDKKTTLSFYENDIQGNMLTMRNPSGLKETLSTLVFPSSIGSNPIVGTKVDKIQARLFSILGLFKGPGIVGYLLVFILIILVTRLPTLTRKLSIARKYRNRRDVTGILGRQKSKD